MKILWLGADSSLETPVGNNVIRRFHKFKGDVLDWDELVDATPAVLDKYDVIGFWCGVQNYSAMAWLPTLRKYTKGKIITNLWASGGAEAGWSWDHQALLFNNSKCFDALISSHKCHIQLYKTLGVPTFYLSHPIELEKYKPFMRKHPPKVPCVLIGSGGVTPGRGFFYSLVVFKKLQEQFPDLIGMCVMGKEYIRNTAALLDSVGVKNVQIYKGGLWHDYIKLISRKATFQILMFTYSGFDRTTMDGAAVGIPVITPRNLFSGEELFPRLNVSGYWATEEAVSRGKQLLNDSGHYNVVTTFARVMIRNHDINSVALEFERILEAIGVEL